MQAIISGALGSAALISGENAEIHWIDGRTKNVSAQQAMNIYRKTEDAVYLEPCSKSQAIDSLKKNWRKDRALMLMLIYLDSTTPPDERFEIQPLLNNLLDYGYVSQYLVSVMYSTPLPVKETISKVELDLQSKVGDFLSNLFNDQEQIRRTREAWDSATSGLISSAKERFEEKLIAVGAFQRLISHNKADINSLKFDLLQASSVLPNHRDVVNNFLNPFIDLCDVIKADQEQNDFELEDKSVASYRPAVVAKTSHAQYTHIKEQLRNANSYFKLGEFDEAVKIINWLVEEQVSRNDTEHVIMTLCNASEMAKHVGRFDLQLEFAQNSNELAPFDNRSLGHLGDAFFNLGRYEEARTSFQSITGADEPMMEYAQSGLIRILRNEHRLQEALEISSEILARNRDASINAYLQNAEILRELHMYEQAIEAYSITIAKYPLSQIPLCGKAATCGDAGQYELAIDAYNKAISNFPDDAVSKTGQGHLLARLGKLDIALPLLNRGIELAEDKTVGINALASAYRIHGKYGIAIRILKNESERNPGSEATWINLIESATDSGRYNEATTFLNNAIANLGSTSKLTLQRVKIMAAKGENRAALELFDGDFDSSSTLPELVVEKARILRKLAKFDEAKHEMEILLEDRGPNSYSIIEATLSGIVDVSEESFKNRAGKKVYASVDDWEYDRACSVIFLKKHEIKNAWRMSLDGKKRSPFKSARRKFCLILAITQDFLGKTGSLFRSLRGYTGFGALLVRAFAYWRLGAKEKLGRIVHEIKRSRNCENYAASFMDDFYKLVSTVYDKNLHKQKADNLEYSVLLQEV